MEVSTLIIFNKYPAHKTNGQTDGGYFQALSSLHNGGQKSKIYVMTYTKSHQSNEGNSSIIGYFIFCITGPFCHLTLENTRGTSKLIFLFIYFNSAVNNWESTLSFCRQKLIKHTVVEQNLRKTSLTIVCRFILRSKIQRLMVSRLKVFP